ncbi:MAG: L,D-transpeptidase family protein [Proteobacteria bacterium]|nr:L,D-transpeptidase family protein [Pseudomonadota bacterium]
MKNNKMNLLSPIYVCLAILVFCSGVAADNTLPASIITLPEKGNAILVEKESQTLYVYSLKAKDNNLAFKAACSTGEAPGPKKKAGDKKTPEGVYFLIDKYEERYLTPIYGKKAFPSDYPNFLDQRRGKEGSAIWIHGTDKVLKPMDSNGCIALENNNIVSLADYIQLDSTPLIIVEKILKTDPDVQALKEKEILKLLDNWAHTMETGSYHQYLAFYSEEYLPNISWWETWSTLREKAISDKRPLTMEMASVGIYAHDDVVVALFDFSLASGKEKILIGKKKLFIKESAQAYKIVGDVIHKKSEPYKAIDVPLIAAAQKLVNFKTREIPPMEMVQKWLAAWSSKNMDAYAGFYADDFYSDGLDKKSWVKRKTQLAQKYNYITVTGKNFKITTKKDGCEVTFLQEYESSNFSTKGTKQLKLVKKGGLWKISQENWKEK